MAELKTSFHDLMLEVISSYVNFKNEVIRQLLTVATGESISRSAVAVDD
jgi:hypothetical protein